MPAAVKLARDIDISYHDPFTQFISERVFQAVLQNLKYGPYMHSRILK